MLVIIMGKCDHVHIYGNDVSKTFMCVCGHLSSAKLKVSFFFPTCCQANMSERRSLKLSPSTVIACIA